MAFACNFRALAGCLWLIGLCHGASADNSFPGPRIEPVAVNWQEAEQASASSLADLNTAAARHVPDIARSGLPVLLPLDTDRMLRDHASGEHNADDVYLGGFTPTGFFLPGPSGYDAVFSFNTARVAGFSDIKFSRPILVTISGFAFLYELPPPAARTDQTAPPKLAAEFPGLRRQILESTLRYSFERYGAPYVVSIQCYDAPHTSRRLSCRNADRIAQHFLRALRLSGGAKAETPAANDPPRSQRPQETSRVFTYHPAGRLIPGTGLKGHGGNADSTVYARIRFPLADAPAYANSQSFMNWGDCNQTGRRPRPGSKDAPYRCRVNSKPLVFNEAAPENYSYPWRDNFCEHRHFYVGQCPSGQGHQGQDVRPATCRLRNEGADRCEAYLDDVVAVRDGTIMREDWQESFLLYANAANERVRFRYMHMHPGQMNEGKLLSGRAVREGETLGKVGNYNRRNNGTTYHLHFEMHVPTRDGWVRVNPYMTLVAAYEHLIQARGVEITDPGDEPEDLAGHEEATSSKIGKPRQNTRKGSRKAPRKGKPRSKRR